MERHRPATQAREWGKAQVPVETTSFFHVGDWWWLCVTLQDPRCTSATALAVRKQQSCRNLQGRTTPVSTRSKHIRTYTERGQELIKELLKS